MKNIFKVGDWCFCEFKLCQIGRMEGNKVIEITTGWVRMNSSDLSDRCFPMSLAVKTFSESVDAEYERLRKASKNLNFPDLHREYVRRWVDICDCLMEDDIETANELFKEVVWFTDKVLEKVETLKDITVCGINILRK